jgi:hypothetical protein
LRRQRSEWTVSGINRSQAHQTLFDDISSGAKRDDDDGVNEVFFVSEFLFPHGQFHQFGVLHGKILACDAVDAVHDEHVQDDVEVEQETEVYFRGTYTIMSWNFIRHVY